MYKFEKLLAILKPWGDKKFIQSQFRCEVVHRFMTTWTSKSSEKGNEEIIVKMNGQRNDRLTVRLIAEIVIIDSLAVNVTWKPRNVTISTPKNTLDLSTFEKYRLVCSADANPAAEFTWKIRHPNMTKPVIKHWEFNESKRASLINN